MTDRIIIERLIGHIRSYIVDLKPVAAVTFRDYSGDVRLQRFVERTLHIASRPVST